MSKLGYNRFGRDPRVKRLKNLRERYGHWHYRVSVGGQELTGDTGLEATKQNVKRAQTIAEEKRQKAKADLLRYQQIQPSVTLFRDAAEEFLAWAEDVEYRSKPNTAHRIRTSFASLAMFFGERPVDAITPGDIERYKHWRIAECGVRDSTLRNDLLNLSVFFRKWALKFGWVETNPVAAVTKPSDAEAIRIYVLSPEEESAYFEKCVELEKKNLHDAARLILLQGCRPEEIMSLPQSAVDLDGAQLRIAGGKSRAARRTLDLVGESVAILSRRLGSPGKWVFPSPRYPGRHMTKLNGVHDTVCREAGLSFCLYDLRHTFATRMVEAGCDLPTLAGILGHSSLRLVMRYVHPTAQHRKEAMKKYEAAIRPRLKAV